MSKTTITNCYYLEGIEKENKTTIVLQDAELSTKKTMNEMQQEQFVKDLNKGNTEEIWEQDKNNENYGYPILK